MVRVSAPWYKTLPNDLSEICQLRALTLGDGHSIQHHHGPTLLRRGSEFIRSGVCCGRHSMPLYFFHISGAVTHTDRIGQELADEEAAWSIAVSSMGELLRDLDGKMPDTATIRTVVTDDDEKRLISIEVIAQRYVGKGAS